MRIVRLLTIVAAGLAMSSSVVAEHHQEGACVDYGPQTPRDIDSAIGENQRLFSVAPGYADMNLCNIHFHVNAEHKAADYSIAAEPTADGHSGGYKCNLSTALTAEELTEPAENHCKDIRPGDTIEVHWVFSSCAVTPGEGLGSCLSDKCANPDLRVEAQVFTVVNDAAAVNFASLAYGGHVADGLHQPKSLPSDTGDPVVFLGSTTGPKYTEAKCSPLQVTWSVRPKCAKIDMNSLSTWCKSNVFNEDHAHGVRELVVNPALLSEIK